MTGPQREEPASGAAVTPRRRAWRYLRRALVIVGLLLTLAVALFVVNGTLLCRGEAPYVKTTSHPAAGPLGDRLPVTLKIMAFNIAKCFAPKGGIRFEEREVVAERGRRIAEVIRAEAPDLVFLSETMTECTPCPVNQVATLAERTGMHTWAFGENYNFGLPFYRVVGGNAILSRWPLEPVANPALAGRRPFYITKNSRRALWCAMPIGGRRVLLASVHNDSYDSSNNLRQTQELLDFAAGQDAIIAGDFNAGPGEPSIELVRKTERFTGAFDGPPTFPADRPDQRIDLILAPSTWELEEHRVIATEVSDHRPVVSTFRVK